MSEQLLVTKCFFLTCSWRFLRSNELEQLEFKSEKNVGIQKHAGKVRKRIFAQGLENICLIFLPDFDICQQHESAKLSSVQCNNTCLYIFPLHIFRIYIRNPTYKVHLESICCYILFAFFSLPASSMILIAVFSF